MGGMYPFISQADLSSRRVATTLRLSMVTVVTVMVVVVKSGMAGTGGAAPWLQSMETEYQHIHGFREEVENYLKEYDEGLSSLRREVDRAQWDVKRRPWNGELQDRVQRSRARLAEFVEHGRAWVSNYFSQLAITPQLRLTLTAPTSRMIDLIRQGPSYSPGLARELAYLLGRMRSIYAGVALNHRGRIYHGEFVAETMGSSRDPGLLLGLWTKWRFLLGRGLRPIYLRAVEVMNQAARRAGYHDMGECWREELEMDEAPTTDDLPFCPQNACQQAFKKPNANIFGARTPADNMNTRQNPRNDQMVGSDISLLRREVERLYLDVLPEYSLLHALARRGLAACYGEEDLIGPRALPAHLLGDMWAENWQTLRDLILWPSEARVSCSPSSSRNHILSFKGTRRSPQENINLRTNGEIRRPHKRPNTPEEGDAPGSPSSSFRKERSKNVPAGGESIEGDLERLLAITSRVLEPGSVDSSPQGKEGPEALYLLEFEVTASLRRKGYSARDMVKEAEDFYRSLGFPELPSSFWTESVFGEPPHSNFSCHPISYNLGRRDYRMVFCGPVNREGLAVVHHELGHVHYYDSYAHLPAIFRDGANSAFHEAVGDAMVLSAMTPENLWRQGHLTSPSLSPGEELAYLATVALQKLPLLVYARVLEEWRWTVMEGHVPLGSLNAFWWALREKLEGVRAPVPRTEDDLDAVAKFHVADNLPYIRYMLSVVLQFQIHKGLCEAKHGVPLPIALHRCNIAGSRRAGEKLRRAMRRGRSVHWQDTLEELTGSRSLQIEPLKEYLGPFLTWLRQEVRRGNLTVGW